MRCVLKGSQLGNSAWDPTRQLVVGKVEVAAIGQHPKTPPTSHADGQGALNSQTGDRKSGKVLASSDAIAGSYCTYFMAVRAPMVLGMHDDSKFQDKSRYLTVRQQRHDRTQHPRLLNPNDCIQRFVLLQRRTASARPLTSIQSERREMTAVFL